MKAENTTKIQFDSLSVNEAYARGAAAAFVSLNSSIEFQAPQDGHFPYHLGLS